MSNETPSVKVNKVASIKKAVTSKLHTEAVDVNSEQVIKELASNAGVKVNFSSSSSKNVVSMGGNKEPAKKVRASKDVKPKTNKQKGEEAFSSLSLSLIDYTEKSIALFGDTKPIKEELKKLKGRYNPCLHPFGAESSVPGWVFPRKSVEEVQNLISKYKK